MIDMLRLVGSSDANMSGRHGDVPPLTSLGGAAHFPAIAMLVTLAAMIIPADLLASPLAITATCAALLLGGLPHGALDLAVVHREAPSRTGRLLMLYIALAAVMFGAWQIAPTIALALFLAMAVTHFAEDWTATEHPFFALGISIATIAAPALFHHAELAGLFVLIAGEPAAARMADALMLIAPVAVACALLAMLLLWKAGQRATAVNAACALAAMTWLPPVTGFAIYFCLLHSPNHFRAGLNRLAPTVGVARSTIVATLGGLAVALAILQFLPITEPSGRLFVASFMTLSILTLPHMAVPLIVRHLGVSARLSRLR